MKKQIRPYLLTLTLIIALPALGNDCSDIDLRDEVLGSVRNQGSVGWCFAHAAADVISYKLGQRISVTELATTYFKHRRGSEVERWEKAGFEEGGWVKAALKIALKNDVCLEEDLPTENFKLLMDSPAKHAPQFFGSLSTISHAIDGLVDIKQNMDSENRLYIFLPHVDKQEMFQILEENEVKLAWEKIVDRSCEGRKLKLSDVKVKSPFWTRVSKKRNFKVIDQELEKKNILGVSYYSAFLQNLKAKRRGAHASVIVGRRWNENKNTCEYLIRNSWGTSCSYYDPGLDCEAGNVWVPRDILRKNIHYVDYLQSTSGSET